MSKQNNFIKEDEIKFLNPIEACRKRPSMYIGNPTNANILLKECVENAEDEASLGRAKSIFVNTNFNGGFKIVCDDGAGIPISISQYVEGEVSAAVALINFHAGSKFEASDVSRTGMFGIGLAAVSALSEVTILMSKITPENYDRSTPQVKKVWEEAGPRSKKDLFYIVITEKGEKTYEGAGKLKDLEKMIFKGIKDYDHIPEGQSTIILFRPDPEIFESVEAEAPVMGLSYFLLIQEKFYNRFIEVTLNGQKLINPFSPYKYQFTKRIIPKDNSKNPFIDVYFTFDVDPELGKPVEWGSVNGLDCNGYHIALMKNLYKAAIKDYFKIKHDYILEGLNFGVVILAADCNFSGQIKDNLKSFTRVKIDDFTPVVKEIEKIFKKDEDYWRDHINKLNQLWDARRDIGAIEKAQKMIDNSTGVNMYRNKASYVKGFVDATAGQKDRWNCELFIVEGLSAGQSLISGRPDTKNFAILPLRGKILNVSSKTSDQALDSQTIYSMYNCIGLGIDQNNVLQDCTTYEEAMQVLQQKSRYGKIIISVDNDPDGSAICNELLHLFGKFSKFMIEAGIIYRAMGPLFKGRSKSTGKDIYFFPDDPVDKNTGLPLDLDTKGHTIYYKGLGSLSPDTGEVEDIFFDKTKRRLIQITPEGLDYMMKLNEDINERKNLLFNNGILSNPYNFNDL